MRLESIKLQNFRQFRNESVDFAQGENGKNVTIIIGENGTGKTTFAQAFSGVCMERQNSLIKPFSIKLLRLKCALDRKKG
ncbi:MAG: AAA family ATPase [[Clostridium] scindens]